MPSTVERRVKMLRQIAKNCNLNDTNQVKTWLAKPECKWSNRTKRKFLDDYTAYLKYAKLSWQAPSYTITEKIPFIPTEQEIDALISGTGKQVATALQTIKETAIRIGEACMLKWIDINYQNKTLNVTPEKGSNPRILPISDKLIAMINRLPKNRETVFQPQSKYLRTYFCEQRRTVSEKLQNPRLTKISFHTLRHWKATMEYHKTKDIKHVQYMLGHRNSKNTDIYITIEQSLYTADTDEWITKISHNLEEETKLIEANFNLVRAINETTAIYKKRK
jgi:integrase